MDSLTAPVAPFAAPFPSLVFLRLRQPILHVVLCIRYVRGGDTDETGLELLYLSKITVRHQTMRTRRHFIYLVHSAPNVISNPKPGLVNACLTSEKEAR